MTATYTFDVFASLDGYDEEQRMVFGARTYLAHARMLAASTEDSEVHDPWVTRMRSLPATVVSSTLEEPLDWPDATVVRGVDRHTQELVYRPSLHG
jgi:hypothetical protein